MFLIATHFLYPKILTTKNSGSWCYQTIHNGFYSVGMLTMVFMRSGYPEYSLMSGTDGGTRCLCHTPRKYSVPECRI
ncbi:MAG: hypothetical protein KAH18_00065 [Psychromonas sp.]|nr:hypothetical protein [Psychromonas sp.]